MQGICGASNKHAAVIMHWPERTTAVLTLLVKGGILLIGAVDLRTIQQFANVLQCQSSNEFKLYIYIYTSLLKKKRRGSYRKQF